ncbi:MAG: hypothetical protein P3W91_006830, partial [Fervidobacterium sp.]|nr:hypothetical protein [Fervidobacterium sp.]
GSGYSIDIYSTDTGTINSGNPSRLIRWTKTNVNFNASKPLTKAYFGWAASSSVGVPNIDWLAIARYNPNVTASIKGGSFILTNNTGTELTDFQVSVPASAFGITTLNEGVSIFTISDDIAPKYNLRVLAKSSYVKPRALNHTTLQTRFLINAISSKPKDNQIYRISELLYDGSNVVVRNFNQNKTLRTRLIAPTYLLSDVEESTTGVLGHVAVLPTLSEYLAVKPNGKLTKFDINTGSETEFLTLPEGYTDVIRGYNNLYYIYGANKPLLVYDIRRNSYTQANFTSSAQYVMAGPGNRYLIALETGAVKIYSFEYKTTHSISLSRTFTPDVVTNAPYNTGIDGKIYILGNNDTDILVIDCENKTVNFKQIPTAYRGYGGFVAVAGGTYFMSIPATASTQQTIRLHVTGTDLYFIIPVPGLIVNGNVTTNVDASRRFGLFNAVFTTDSPNSIYQIIYTTYGFKPAALDIAEVQLKGAHISAILNSPVDALNRTKEVSPKSVVRVSKVAQRAIKTDVDFIKTVSLDATYQTANILFYSLRTAVKLENVVKATPILVGLSVKRSCELQSPAVVLTIPKSTNLNSQIRYLGNSASKSLADVESLTQTVHYPVDDVIAFAWTKTVSVPKVYITMSGIQATKQIQHSSFTFTLNKALKETVSLLRTFSSMLKNAIVYVHTKQNVISMLPRVTAQKVVDLKEKLLALRQFAIQLTEAKIVQTTYKPELLSSAPFTFKAPKYISSAVMWTFDKHVDIATRTVHVGSKTYPIEEAYQPTLTIQLMSAVLRQDKLNVLINEKMLYAGRLNYQVITGIIYEAYKQFELLGRIVALRYKFTEPVYDKILVQNYHYSMLYMTKLRNINRVIQHIMKERSLFIRYHANLPIHDVIKVINYKRRALKTWVVRQYVPSRKVTFTVPELEGQAEPITTTSKFTSVIIGRARYVVEGQNAYVGRFSYGNTGNMFTAKLYIPEGYELKELKVYLVPETEATTFDYKVFTLRYFDGLIEKPEIKERYIEVSKLLSKYNFAQYSTDEAVRNNPSGYVVIPTDLVIREFDMADVEVYGSILTEHEGEYYLAAPSFAVYIMYYAEPKADSVISTQPVSVSSMIDIEQKLGPVVPFNELGFATKLALETTGASNILVMNLVEQDLETQLLFTSSLPSSYAISVLKYIKDPFEAQALAGTLSKLPTIVRYSKLIQFAVLYDADTVDSEIYKEFVKYVSPFKSQNVRLFVLPYLKYKYEKMTMPLPGYVLLGAFGAYEDKQATTNSTMKLTLLNIQQFRGILEKSVVETYKTNSEHIIKEAVNIVEELPDNTLHAVPDVVTNSILKEGRNARIFATLLKYLQDKLKTLNQYINKDVLNALFNEGVQLIKPMVKSCNVLEVQQHGNRFVVKLEVEFIGMVSPAYLDVTIE